MEAQFADLCVEIIILIKQLYRALQWKGPCRLPRPTPTWSREEILSQKWSGTLFRIVRLGLATGEMAGRRDIECVTVTSGLLLYQFWEISKKCIFLGTTGNSIVKPWSVQHWLCCYVTSRFVCIRDIMTQPTLPFLCIFFSHNCS